jgi:hypothetical protein
MIDRYLISCYLDFMEICYPDIFPGFILKKGHTLFFKKTPGFDAELDVKDDEREKDEDDKKFFLCKVCRQLITPYETKINIDGHHRHTFVNPAGIEYSIGCFSSADGCYETGIPTVQYTWFPGYRWCYALCSKCRSHLGWSYKSSNSGFYGLILENLIVS